jgi:hypothetical protein
VAKSLVEAMGGRIWAAGRDGGGAEFGFALAALVEPGEELPGQRSTRGSGRGVDRDGPPLRQ